MGIFSSKKKTYVGSSSSRLVEDLMVPNSILSGTTRAILKDGDISQSVMSELSAGIGSRAQSMYSFGRNGYIFGTPDAQLQTSVVGATELQAVLELLYGGELVMDYHHVGAPNILHIARMKLIRDHGYNPQTNQLGLLTASTGLPVFVHDLVVVLPQATAALYGAAAIEQWGSAPKKGASPTRPSYVIAPQLSRVPQFTPVESAAVAEDHVRVEYAWTTAAGAIQRGSFIIGNSEFAEDADFFHVGLTLDGVEQQYWMYQAGTGVHPSLDVLVDTGEVGQAVGTFFPFIHFRSNKQSIAVDPLSTEYKHSVKMAKKLGVDFMQVHDAIHENPDIGDIAQAYLAMMVPITSTNAIDRRFLHDFFTALHSSGIGIAPLPVMSNIVTRGARQETPRSIVLVQDTKVKHILSCTGITKKLVSGDLTDGLKYESGYLAVSESRKHHFFKRQVTPGVYEEIQVFGLEMRYWVDGGYTAVGDEVDAELLIPVDYAISRNYSMKLQEELYARSLRLIANSSVTVTVKWYQKPEFGIFLQIVGIAMFFFDGGLTLAIAEGLIAVLTYIAVAILWQIVLTVGFSLVVKLLGVDLAIVVAVLAAVYGVTAALQNGIKTALPTIIEMLTVATGLVKASAKVVMDDLLELGQEFEAFKDEAKEQMKLLEETKTLLDSSTRLDPLVIYGETPDKYYNRTVHSGNVGTIGYQAIELYVDMALTLPTISDSLGGADYVEEYAV